MIHYLQPPTKHLDIDRVVLSGLEYILTWRWNSRTGRWWLLIEDQTGVIAYIPIVEGFPLLVCVSGTRRPPGELFVLDLQEEGGEPGLYDWDRYAIVYDDQEDDL